MRWFFNKVKVARIGITIFHLEVTFNLQKVEMEPIPDWLEEGRMTIEEFASSAGSFFTGYDGNGYWATATHEFPGPIYGWIDPDNFNPKDAPKGATHVAWYNK